MLKIKVVLINLVALVVVYVAIELPYSTYHYFKSAYCPNSCWLYEHPGQTVRFDPDRGYFLGSAPSRMARITKGQLEWTGTLRGNAEGFASREDFIPKRTNPRQWRLAVFGDSFTTAEYFSRNWPARVEDDTGEESLQLLNFGVDGAGLANWESVLRNIVVKDNYQIDGVLIAVAWDDLDRKFTILDQVDPQTVAYARSPSWNPSSYPKTEAQARALITKNPHTFVVSSTEFDEAVAGRWRAPKEWHFQIFDKFEVVSRRFLHRNLSTEEEGFDPGQVALIQEIRKLAEQESVPIAVAYIPFREELLDPHHGGNVERTRKFAELLGAAFVDGREAYRGLTPEQIRSDWYTYDGHWNQSGSDQFADFMAPQIVRWLQSRNPRTPARPAPAIRHAAVPPSGVL